MADEPDMKFLMLLANVIVCLQLNFALYNTMMTSYGRSRVQFEQEIGFVDQEDFEFDGLVAKANAVHA